MSRGRRHGIRKLWQVPDAILKAQGDYLGKDDGKVIKRLALVRSVCGVLILVCVALTYPGFTKSLPELISTAGNTPADVTAISRLADGWLTTILYGILISVLSVIVFAVVIVASARSRERLHAVRRMCLPVIAFVLFAVLLAAIVGVVDLLNWVTTRLTGQTSDLSSSPGALGIAAVQIIILIVLFVAIVPTLAILYTKSIYLAAVDVFRADDAHPLLAPFATTVVAWSLATAAYLAGGPTGLPHDRWLVITFGGAVTVSVLNALACCSLWSNHHDLLFKGGPPSPGPRTRGSAFSDLIPKAFISGAVFALGLSCFGVILLGVHFLSTPKISGPVSLRWSYLTGSYASSPAVADGTVYVGSDDRKLYALNAATGHLRWSYTAGDRIYAGPAVSGGIVYIGSDDGKLYALDAATGRLRWSFTSHYAIESTPVVANGTVYFGGFDHKVYALSAATGRLRWSYSAQDAVTSSPVVAGGTVYFDSFDHRVYALNAATGHLRWSYATGGDVFSSPAVSSGVVYVGSEDGKVYALNASNGHLRWSYTTGGDVFSSPAVSGGVVYIGSDDEKVYALDAATGQLRWSHATGDWVNSSPVVAGGLVYVGSNDSRVYALDAATGHVRWYYTTGDSVISKPAVSGSSVYAGSSDDSVYALNTTG
jgi:outer membrane protein assembly factor BamB